MPLPPQKCRRSPSAAIPKVSDSFALGFCSSDKVIVRDWSCKLCRFSSAYCFSEQRDHPAARLNQKHALVRPPALTPKSCTVQSNPGHRCMARCLYSSMTDCLGIETEAMRLAILRLHNNASLARQCCDACVLADVMRSITVVSVALELV